MLYLFIACGALVAWSKLTRDEARTYMLSNVLDLFLEKSGKGRTLLELIIFVGLGILIGDAIVQPTTKTQALSAGLGWTAMLSGPSRSERDDDRGH